MKDIVLIPIPKDQFIDELIDRLIQRKDLIVPVSSQDEQIYLTAKETASLCKVTTVTVHEWTKKGILTKYKIGNRVFYKRDEIISSFNKIEH